MSSPFFNKTYFKSQNIPWLQMQRKSGFLFSCIWTKHFALWEMSQRKLVNCGLFSLIVHTWNDQSDSKCTMNEPSTHNKLIYPTHSCKFLSTGTTVCPLAAGDKRPASPSAWTSVCKSAFTATAIFNASSLNACAVTQVILCVSLILSHAHAVV